MHLPPHLAILQVQLWRKRVDVGPTGSLSLSMHIPSHQDNIKQNLKQQSRLLRNFLGRN
jgi:hypothetical protein